MKTAIFIILFASLPSLAQINLILPESLRVVVNDELFPVNKTWYDSLRSEAEHNNMHYHLAAYHRLNNRTVISKLKIPQTFFFSKVIRQVIFYYSFLGSNHERQKETVLVYPYFEDIDEPEYIKCNYSDNTFNFQLKYWRRESPPSPPTPEEKFIYNLILENSIQNTSVLEEVPEEALQDVSRDKNKKYDEIYQIYKKCVLWNTQIR